MGSVGAKACHKPVVRARCLGSVVDPATGKVLRDKTTYSERVMALEDIASKSLQIVGRHRHQDQWRRAGLGVTTYDLLLRLVEKENYWVRGSNLYALLATMCSNQARDAWRSPSQKGRDQRHVDDLPEPACRMSSPESIIDRQRQLGAVNDIVAPEDLPLLEASLDPRLDADQVDRLDPEAAEADMTRIAAFRAEVDALIPSNDHDLTLLADALTVQLYLQLRNLRVNAFQHRRRRLLVKVRGKLKHAR